MATLVFGIGIPGSGKTTILEKFARDHSYEFISIDEMKIQKLGNVHDNSMAKEIWYEARARMKELLSQGKNVVFDSTFSARDRRDHFLGVVRTVPNVKVEALYFDIPLEHILERNAARGASGGKQVPDEFIREWYGTLQKEPPTPDEDFDVLLRIDEHGNVTALKGSDSDLQRSF